MERKGRAVHLGPRVLVACLAALAGCSGSGGGAGKGQQNIVVLLVDDLDLESTKSALENGWMPNLQTHVIDEGVTFEESFVSFSLCCPSRATYLTGQYPHNHGIQSNSEESGGFDQFDDSSTIATWLQAVGYRTGHVGKYLNGYGETSGCLRRGIRCERYVPPGWDDWQGLVDPTTYRMYDYTINDNGTLVDYGSAESDYQTDVLAARAVDFIVESEKEDDRKPFFLTITPLAPHRESRDDTVRPAPRHEGTVSLPLPMPPSFNEEDMSDKPGWMQDLPALDEEGIGNVEMLYNDRIASLRAVDDLIGSVVAALVEARELDRTALLFTSDNGFLLGLHRWVSKVLLYEESIRVPLFARVPGVEGPRRVAEFVLNNDLAPTFAALAGAEPGLPVDGRSLLSVLDGTPGGWRRRFLVEGPPPGEGDRYPRFWAVREAERIYAEFYERDGTGPIDTEYYDLRTDPYQLDNAREPPPGAGLEGYLEGLRGCAAETCRQIEDDTEGAEG